MKRGTGKGGTGNAGSDKGGIALERIHRLFELAREETPKNAERSCAYVELARKVSSRNRQRIPQNLKHSFCKKCNSLLLPRNSKSRVKGKWLNVTCLKCGATKRIWLGKGDISAICA